MAYDDLLGTILVATWINCMLYSLEAVQLVRYLETFYSKDRKLFRIAAFTAFFIDTACTMFTCADVYLYAVTHWGQPSYLIEQPWPQPVYVGLTGAAGSIVQVFLVARYFTLTKRRITTAILSALVLTSTAGCLLATYTLSKYSAYTDRRKAVLSGIIWLASSVTADIAIALALIIHLVRQELVFKATKRLVRTLVSIAIKTGTVTVIFAILIIVTFFTSITTNISSAVTFCLGRVYTLTMFYNLQARQDLRDVEMTLDLSNLKVGVTSNKGTSNTNTPSGPCLNSRPGPLTMADNNPTTNIPSRNSQSV